MTRRTSLLLSIALVLLMAFTLLSAAPAPVFRNEAPPKSITNSLGMKLARIPAGKFLMGSPKGEERRLDHEGPEHEVKITRAFYLGVYEVTQGEYQRVMGGNPSSFSAMGGGKHLVKGERTARFPVENVSHEDAVTFCAKLSATKQEKADRRVYRLPTEAEWEYACRGGATSKSPFHFGKTLCSFQANFDGTHPHGGGVGGPDLGRTCEVGSYLPNDYGLYDMHGNVWEWCSDWYGEKYYADSPRDDPPGPSQGKFRVVRGGGWKNGDAGCRSAYRTGDGKFGYDYIGFRIAQMPFD